MNMELVTAQINSFMNSVRDGFGELEEQRAECERSIAALREQIAALQTELVQKQRAIAAVNDQHAEAISRAKAETAAKERKLAECRQRLARLFDSAA